MRRSFPPKETRVHSRCKGRALRARSETTLECIYTDPGYGAPLFWGKVVSKFFDLPYILQDLLFCSLC